MCLEAARRTAGEHSESVDAFCGDSGCVDFNGSDGFSEMMLEASGTYDICLEGEQICNGIGIWW
jgi:hypothetical protein